MKKHLKDYLHLYLGCECYYDRTHYAGKLIGIEDDSAITWDTVNGRVVWPLRRMLPILRPLSDMTDEEAKYFKVTKGIDRNLKTLGGSIWTFEEVKELLSKHFDLFGLIPRLAIDKTTK